MDKEAITQKGREDIVSGQPQIVEQLSDGSAGAEEHSPDTVAIVTRPLQDKVVDVAVLVADRDTRLVDLRRRQTIVSGQLEDIQQGEQVLRQTAHITSFVIQLKAEQLNQENGKETDRNDFSIDLGPNQPFNQGHGGETADHEGRLKLINWPFGRQEEACSYPVKTDTCKKLRSSIGDAFDSEELGKTSCSKAVATRQYQGGANWRE